MMRIISLVLLGMVISCHGPKNSSPADLVDPMIGTESTPAFSHGNVYPSVTRPFGLTAWTPQTGEWGWIYTYQSEKLQGIRATHQPSPWMGDYGQFTFMVGQGEIVTDDEKRSVAFTHAAEESHPYHYKVDLEMPNSTVEVTPTTRAASLRFSFHEAQDNHFIMDLSNAKANISINGNIVSGYTTINSGGVPSNFACYFYGEILGNIESSGTWQSDSIYDQPGMEGKNIGAWFKTGSEEIEIKIATSFISSDQAKVNLEKEIGNKGFNDVVSEAREEWNKKLSIIEVETITEEDQVTFYSNLYRVMTFPRIWYELDAKGDTLHYSAYDGDVHAGVMFADNGFWDTFRTEFPLLTLLFPEQTGTMIQGFINAYKEGDWLPKWTSPGYRNVMIGTHMASLAADSWKKGIRNFELKTLYEAAKKDIFELPPAGGPGRSGNPWYLDLGYVPYDKVHEATARTLEYAYGDFCVSELARHLDEKEDRYYFLNLSKNYSNVYDPDAGFMRGRKSDGTWRPDFSPLEWGGPFTEGSSWHYSWSVMHDHQHLIELMGGEDAFVAKLDKMFETSPDFLVGSYGAEIHEMTEMVAGNMGQYAHGNQPVHHVLYLYNYARQPWKTEFHVREVLNKLYGPGPDGYCGDEDNGQMSAWYVMSSLGLYPVTPGTGEYVFGSPNIKSATISLENGNTLKILATNNSAANIYVQRIKFNDLEVDKYFIDHNELIKGGTLEFVMGSEPNTERTNLKVPYSVSNDPALDWENIDINHRPSIMPTVVAPVISGAKTHFSEPLEITLSTDTDKAEIRYTTDGTEVSSHSPLYSGKIRIANTSELKVRAYKNGFYKSPQVSHRFILLNNSYEVTSFTGPNSGYVAAGPLTLIDGQYGTENFRDGFWMGWQGKDVDVVVDLKAPQTISKVGISTLQNQGAWIFLPGSVEVSISNDGKQWNQIWNQAIPIEEDRKGTQLEKYVSSNLEADARFLKFSISSIGSLPSWHPGSGGKPFIFIDELIID